MHPLILLYNPGWATSIFEGPRELTSARVTSECDRLPEAHAVVFHIPTAPDLAGIRKYPGQIWVAFSMESSANYRELSSLEFMRRFDLTMTYRLDSDNPKSYFGWWEMERRLNASAPKTARLRQCTSRPIRLTHGAGRRTFGS